MFIDNQEFKSSCFFLANNKLIMNSQGGSVQEQESAVLQTFSGDRESEARVVQHRIDMDSITIEKDPMMEGKPLRGREPDSESDRGSSAQRSKPISNSSRAKAKLVFPNSFKLDETYSSSEEINRMLRKEEIALGLPTKFMKEIHLGDDVQNKNICIRCRICNAYVDFRNSNGRYSVAVLRNRHTHDREIKTKTEEKPELPNKLLAPQIPKPPANIFPPPPQISQSTSSTSNSLLSLIQQMRSGIAYQAPPVPSFNPQKILASAPLLAPNLRLIPKIVQVNQFKEIENFLLSKNYDLIIEQGRQPFGTNPEIIMAASPAMKTNYKKFGDQVSFHLVAIPRQENSDQAQCHVGIFTVFSHHKKQLLAGFVLFLRQTAPVLKILFEYFFKLHEGRQPQSIVTNYDQSVVQALKQLIQERIYKGAHIIDSNEFIHNLEQELKTRNKVTRQVIELCTQVVVEKSKNMVDRIISGVQDLVEYEDENTKKIVGGFFDQKEKFFKAYIPAVFCGIVDVSDYNVKFNELFLAGFKKDKPGSIEPIIKRLLEIDEELLDGYLTKTVIYSDPIEDVFEDPRIKAVRESLDRSVMNSFLMDYTEAVCNLFVSPPQNADSPIEVDNLVTGEKFTMKGWDCSCGEMKKMGLPCSHVLSVALLQKDLSYMNFIQERWRQQQAEISDSDDGLEAGPMGSEMIVEKEADRPVEEEKKLEIEIDHSEQNLQSVMPKVKLIQNEQAMEAQEKNNGEEVNATKELD